MCNKELLVVRILPMESWIHGQFGLTRVAEIVE